MKKKRQAKRVQTPSGGVSMTEQHHKKACDINSIMAKYTKTGLLDHVSKYEPQYGDATGADFKAAQDLVARQKSIFMELPAEVRAEFKNDPSNYLELITTEGGPQQLAEMLNPQPEPQPKEEVEKPVELKPESEPA